ncbi:MAG: virulence protein E, partial [Clostridia bacterium]|nr:virulence protein E [Clostridia bacterium]
VGSVKRTQVSNMEIWCECFGRERSTIRRSDSNELASILIKLGWVRQPDKVRVTLYGPQYVYVPKAAFPET